MVIISHLYDKNYGAPVNIVLYLKNRQIILSILLDRPYEFFLLLVNIMK